jgi:hypothetical protein
MGRPPGFRVPKPARSRGPSRAAAPSENRHREGDCSVGVAGPPRDPSEDDRVQEFGLSGAGVPRHVGGTAGAQPVYPRKPGPVGLGRILFLWGTSGLPRCKRRSLGGGGNIAGSSILDARGGNLEVVRSNASSAGIGCR